MDIVIGVANSPFVAALLGLIGAFVAWRIYRAKIKSNKKDAANIILLELQNARVKLQAAIERASENPAEEKRVLAESAYIMPNESWSRYKYLFVQDLDRYEWDNISNFYEKCALFDEAVRYNTNAFQKNEEQLRANMFSQEAAVLGDYIKLLNGPRVYGSKAEKVALRKAREVRDIMLVEADDIFDYRPRKPYWWPSIT